MDSSGDEEVTGYDKYRELLVENLEMKNSMKNQEIELQKLKKELDREKNLRLATEEIFQKVL